MNKLIKIITILALLIFITGCEEKPIGKKVVIKSTKDMDSRLKAYPEAIEWYKDSLNSADSSFNLGLFYDDKIKDSTKSIIWYTKAYEMGYKKAAFNLGYLYEDTIKDYNNAIKWYKIAFDNNLNTSTANIGMIYADIKKDYEKAIKWYKKGIEREYTVNKKYCMAIS
ncbi:MAG: tetratricopeptide repeat protein [Arcobacter sp.]|uniref:tetratricopeptide repeat protein n=1 Tax=Arcobacter sp. TaxID=1872629 RepID=UPI003C7740DC